MPGFMQLDTITLILVINIINNIMGCPTHTGVNFECRQQTRSERRAIERHERKMKRKQKESSYYDWSISVSLDTYNEFKKLFDLNE